MFVFKEKGYGKILKGDGKEGQNEMSKNVSRNGSSGTASTKGLFCSKLHISLLLLQFPSAAKCISTHSTKQSNEVSYGIL